MLAVETLDNGLGVVLHPDPRLPLVAVHLGYSAGSRHDPAGRSGLAHLCEHLSFAGRRDSFADLARAIEETGGTTNGGTAHDRTSFSSVVGVPHLDLALEMEASRMASAPELADGVIEREREVIAQERLQTVDNRPYGRAIPLLHELLYPPGHPYSRPPIGTVEDLREIGRDAVAAFFDRHYRPQVAVLTLAGRLSPLPTMAAIERRFGALEPGDLRSPFEPGPAEPLAGTTRRTVVEPVPRARTYVGYRFPGFGTRERCAAVLLAHTLMVDRASPLRRRLIGGGIAAAINALTVTMRDATTLVLSATAAPEVEASRLTAALLDALDRALEAGVDPAALDRARKKVATDHHAALQYLDQRADRLSSWAAFAGAPEGLERELDPCRELDAAAVGAIAHRSCRDGAGRAVLEVTPR